MPLITLQSSTDVVVLYGDDPYASGFTYRNDTLTSWYKFAGADGKLEKRPNGVGTFGVGKLYPNEQTLEVKGSFWGGSAIDATYARERLTGLFADGDPVTYTVADETGAWSRQVNLLEADVPYLPYPNFEFTLNLVAVDPRRFGPTQTFTTGVPVAASGLIWPLGSSSRYTRYAWTGTAYASTSTVTTSTTTRTNYSTNPSPEGGTTTGLTTNPYGPTGTIAVSSDRARLATRMKSWRYLAVGGGNGEGVSFTVPTGRRYVSIWVYNPSTSGVDHLGITGLPTGGGAQTPVTRTTAKDAWVQLFLDMGGTSGGTAVVYNDDSPALAGTSFYFTDIYIGDDQLDYFDGAFASTTFYFDWGTAGNGGRVAFTNTGNAATVPSFGVDGGGIANGFAITEVETGRQLIYATDVVSGTPITLNGMTQAVQINGAGDYRQRLTKRAWPTIPPRSTRTYQFTPLGAIIGSPALSMSVAAAKL